MVKVEEIKLSDSYQEITDSSNSLNIFVVGNSTENSTQEMAIQLPFNRLKGRENYSEWKVGAKAHMIIKGLWDCCAEELADNANQNQKKTDLRAIGELTLLLEPCNYSHIEGASTCKEAWDSIAKAFDDTGTGRKVALLQQLVSLKQKECASMEDYVNKMSSLWSKVKLAGFKIDDEVAGSLMLVGLPVEYKPMILAIENSTNNITFDYVKNLLMQGLLLDNEKCDLNESALFVKNKKYQNKTAKHCFGCGSKQHFVKNCPKVKNKRKQQHKHDKTEAMLFTSLMVQSCESPSDWYIDSGCTVHMTKYKSIIENICAPLQTEVVVANNEKIPIDCVGSVKQRVLNDGKASDIIMNNVHHVPNICTNLLSVSQMVKNNKSVLFTNDGCKIFDKNWNVMATASLVNDLFKLNVVQDEKSFVAEGKNHERPMITQKPKEDIVLWHRRFGHASFDYMTFLQSELKNVSIPRDNICSTCVKGKQCRSPFNNEGNRATKLLELVHTDVCQASSVESMSGFRHFVSFIDDFSRRVTIYLIKNKSEVYDCFLKFKAMAEKQTDHKLLCLRSDNGSEFCNKKFKEYFEKNGILHQKSTVYSPQQNGLSERMNRTIMDKVRCMLIDSGLPKSFWAEAAMTATYIINRIPCKGTGEKSPEQIWTNRKPNLSVLKVFGCRAYAQVPSVKREKLDSKSVEYIFIGYAADAKAYRLYNTQSNSVVISRDVVFLESNNTEKVIDFQCNQTNNFLLDYSEDEKQDICESGENIPRNELQPTCDPQKFSSTSSQGAPEAVGPSHSERNEDSFTSITNESNGSVWQPSDSDDEDAIQEIEPRQMSTRNQGRPKPDYVSFAFAFLVSDPSTYKEALRSENANSWKCAMQAEFESLQQNETWKLEPLPPGKLPVKCKWVFKAKRDTQGNVVRFKARLVAKGFTQVEGVDYHDTFSPVVRFTTIRYLMATAARFDLNIRQLDVVTAFLHGRLEEEIFMSQPEGFSDGTGRYCKLLKSIYGLKQSSRVWNCTLNQVLLDFGLKRSLTDQCVYHLIKGSRMFIVAVYVDDILLFSNDVGLEQKLTDVLSEQFSMKDMGEASSVLGVRVTRDRKKGNISLDQTHYIKNILSRFKMSDCNPTSAPMDTGQKISSKMCPSNDEERSQMQDVPYRQLVGALQFCVQVSRPDICFPVNVLSRYNHNPGRSHWGAAKRVLRYLKGTVDKKITYNSSAEKQVRGYCDADWASDEDERRSTTGYVFTMQGGAISWCSKQQKTIAISTTEAEFMSMTAAIQECIWLKMFEQELFVNSLPSIVLFCDNRSAINLAVNNAYSARTKHVDVKQKFVHQNVKNGLIKLIHLPTNEMPADILTKPTTGRKLEDFSSIFGFN